MAVGCIITFSPSGQVIARRPYWPWPAPGKYPIELGDGSFEQFFPHNYLRFPLYSYVTPLPSFPYFPQGTPMKTLLSSISITLHKHRYTCDLVLAQYFNTRRPAILLIDSISSEPITTATTNVAEEWLAHLPPHLTVCKMYSENEGLWEQLLPLRDSSEHLIFHPTPHKVLLSEWVTAPVVALGDLAQNLFQDFPCPE